MFGETKTVIGIFENRSGADQALARLESLGYEAQDISLVTSGGTEEVTVNPGNQVAEGAVSGGVIGGLAGLLLGIGAITVPGLGALFIGGPLAAALGLTGAAAATVSGAATGALAGGLVGGLVSLGIPEEEAKIYEERVRSGGVILAVPIREDLDYEQVREVFEERGASQIRTLG